MNLADAKLILSEYSPMVPWIQRLEEARKDLIPECPVCLEDMGPGVAIWQCVNGHLICGDCRVRTFHVCGECRSREGYVSRSRRLEDNISRMMKFLAR